LKGNRFIEFEYRSAVERRERLAIQFEFDGHDRTLRPVVNFVSFLSVAADFLDLGIFEDACIKLRRLFRFVIEP
jgi:hypothetical protein